MRHLRWIVPLSIPLTPIIAFVMLLGFLVVLLQDDEKNQCGAASSAPGVSITGPVDPGLVVAGFSGEQLTNAAAIINAGAAAGMSEQGQTIGVMTAIGESSLINIDSGDAAGPDSRGLFQQRDPWGPLADRMDPAKSATMFFTGGQGGQNGLADIAGWESMEPTLAAHAVQRNADPYHYEKFWGPAQQIVAALTGGAGASSPPAQQVSQPLTAPVDNANGPLQPAAQALADDVWAANLGILSIGGTRTSAIDPNGHPSGNAVDLMIANRDQAAGDRIVAYLEANWDRLGIDYLIWWQRYHDAPGQPGQPMEDRGSDTQNHYDHVHVNTLPGFVPGAPVAPVAQTASCAAPAAPAGAVSADGWTRPTVGPVTSPFGMRNGKPHNGIDFGAACGTPVGAAKAGTVIGVYKNNQPPATGYGTLVVVDHGGGTVTRYAHANNEDVLVSVGQQVAAGQQLTRVGTYGDSTGCHLHFEIQQDDKFVDPAPVLTGAGVVL
jgi:murein DD-endopeptidase MepM/ murein hydrolase activator NlpD